MKIADDILNKSNEINENLSREMMRISYNYKLDEIVGISQLSTKETEEFITKNKLSNVNFIIDEKDYIKSQNNFDLRYETIVKNLEIVEYRKDPTSTDLVIEGITTISLVVVFVILLLGIYSDVFEDIHSKNKIKEELHKSIKITNII
jgi:hypothetical protein